MQIPLQRLYSQHLLGEKFLHPKDVVSYFGAIQAQDYFPSKWGIGLRLQKPTDELVESAFNKGEIVRTHIMRPTWHYVSPENLLWLQKLTSQNVKKLMAHYNRKLELDDSVFKKTNKLITSSLTNNVYLTRQEIKKLLEDIDIKTDVQRLAHILMWAELDGIICSGPRKGKQFTYALVKERIVKHTHYSYEESLFHLAYLYFSSHGPAQLKDFSWWSGLSVKDASSALEIIKPKLSSETVEQKTYWYLPSIKISYEKSVFLVSIYDEFTIAYKDRSDMSQKGDIERMISLGNALTAVLLIDGIVSGTWKRTLKKQIVEVSVSPFRKLTTQEDELVQKQITLLGSYLNLTPKRI